MTVDEQLHYWGGFFLALPYRFLGQDFRDLRVYDIDIWAFNREWRQNLKGKNPNYPMSNAQLNEAKAWGKGARAALRVGTPYPSPPYPPEVSV